MTLAMGFGNPIEIAALFVIVPILIIVAVVALVRKR